MWIIIAWYVFYLLGIFLWAQLEDILCMAKSNIVANAATRSFRPSRRLQGWTVSWAKGWIYNVLWRRRLLLLTEVITSIWYGEGHRELWGEELLGLDIDGHSLQSWKAQSSSSSLHHPQKFKGTRTTTSRSLRCLQHPWKVNQPLSSLRYFCSPVFLRQSLPEREPTRLQSPTLALTHATDQAASHRLSISYFPHLVSYTLGAGSFRFFLSWTSRTVPAHIQPLRKAAFCSWAATWPPCWKAL